MGNQRVTKKKAVGVDFKRVKHKVGRKLPAADNATKTSFKSKAIVLPGQNLGLEKEGLAVTQRKQTLKELLAQCAHYNARVRKDALHGLRELLGEHPRELALHTATVLEALAPRVADMDKAVRDALKLLLRTVVLPGVPEAQLQPFAPLLLVHICSAMTNLVADIRLASLSFLDLLVDRCPRVIGPGFSREILGHYVDLLSRGGPMGRSMQSSLQILSSLRGFLRAAYGSSSADVAAGDRLQIQEQYWGGGAGRGPSRHGFQPKSTEGQVQALHSYRWQVVPGGAASLAGLAESAIGRSEAAVQDDKPSDTPAKSRAKPRSSDALPAVSIAQLPPEIGREHFEVLAGVFAPLLLQCCGECIPSLAAGAASDTTSLQCLLTAIHILRFLFQQLTGEANEGKPAGTQRQTTMWAGMGGHLELGWSETRAAGESFPRAEMRKQYLGPLLHRLRSVFPIVAPAVKQIAKVEEDLVALNVAMCQLLSMFLLGPQDGGMAEGEQQEEAGWEETVLDFYEGALHGTVLPSAGIAKGVTKRRLADPHWKTLLAHLPRLLACTLPARQLSLLEAFTMVYEGARPHSSLKLACLTVMETVLLERAAGIGASNQRPAGGQVALPEELMQRWLHSLPRLVWDLKNSHPDTSEVVLRLLLHIGRCAAPNTPLARHYSFLQPALVGLFCISLPAKKTKSSGKILYGPFVSLPSSCQSLALDVISYQPELSPSLLRALALCCLHSGTAPSVSLRAVEAVHRSYCAGGVKPAELLSFLLTLLLGRAGSQSKGDGARGKRKKEGKEEGGREAGAGKEEGDGEQAGKAEEEGVNMGEEDRKEDEKEEEDNEKEDGGGENEGKMSEGNDVQEGEEEGKKEDVLRTEVECEASTPLMSRKTELDEETPGSGGLAAPMEELATEPSVDDPAEPPPKRMRVDAGEAGKAEAGGNELSDRAVKEEGCSGRAPMEVQSERGDGGEGLREPAGEGAEVGQGGGVDQIGPERDAVLKEPMGEGTQGTEVAMEAKELADRAVRSEGQHSTSLPIGTSRDSPMGGVEDSAEQKEAAEAIDGGGAVGEAEEDESRQGQVKTNGQGEVTTEAGVADTKGGEARASTEETDIESGSVQPISVQQSKGGSEGTTVQRGRERGQEQVEEESAEDRWRRKNQVAAVCSVLAHMGDGGVVLNLLAPAICQELASSPLPRVLEGLLLAIAVCCNRRQIGQRKPHSIPGSLMDVLPPAVARHCIVGCQRAQGEEASRPQLADAQRSRLRPCFVILLAAPPMLPAVIEALGAGVEETDKGDAAEREGVAMAAMDGLRHICAYRPLQKALMEVEAAVRDALLSLKSFVGQPRAPRRENGELTSAYEQLHGVLALLYGWKAEDDEINPT